MTPPLIREIRIMDAGQIVLVITAVLSSPVILSIANKVMNDSSNKKQELTLESISSSLEEYKIKQAIQDLRQKCWKIIETGEVRRYSNQEYYMLYNQLLNLLPEEKWESDLKSEVKEAHDILRGKQH